MRNKYLSTIIYIKKLKKRIKEYKRRGIEAEKIENYSIIIEKKQKLLQEIERLNKLAEIVPVDKRNKFMELQFKLYKLQNSKNAYINRTDKNAQSKMDSIKMKTEIIQNKIDALLSN